MASLLDDQYLNPVYTRSFPDPFILKYRGEYFGYSTGIASDGNVFQMICSTDLVEWHELGGAMLRLETDEPFYWAPEVTYYNGKFYLYYSVGNETLMHLRVAVSDLPEGPFVDSGTRLTTEEFAIDAHVFRDDDGRWFMFYATDFLTHSHIGTGTVVDRMIDPFTLAGDPRPVTRAKHDWQVYDPQRHEKGGVRWHTVEGPTVLKRKGRYFEMFSGGNWQNVSYGVSYAVTDDIDADDEWHQHSDGITTLPVLRTIPDLVIGPGHNSVIRGPNNRELYCVYHRWVGDARVLAIDRMDFSGDNGLIITGPTYKPQIKPFMPYMKGSLLSSDGHDRQLLKGEFRSENGELRSVSPGENEIRYTTAGKSFVAEIYVRSAGGSNGQYGIRLHLAGEEDLKFVIDPGKPRVIVMSDGVEQRSFDLPKAFDPGAYHHFRIETDHLWASIKLDEVDVVFRTQLPSPVSGIGLAADGDSAVFSAFSVTYGFEELFEDENISQRGWTIDNRQGEITFEQKNMLIDCEGGRSVSLSKPVNGPDHELVFNLCVVRMGQRGYLAFGSEPILKLAGADKLDLTLTSNSFPCKGLGIYSQYRIVRIGGKLDLYVDGEYLTSETAADDPAQVTLNVFDAMVAVDMIRYTVI